MELSLQEETEILKEFNMKMNAQYFIDKFQAIPEEKWGTDALQQGNGRRCALGHCTPELDNFPGRQVLNFTNIGLKTYTEEGKALAAVFNKVTEGVVCINDGTSEIYKQDTPKQRILAALQDCLLLEQQDKAVEQIQTIVNQPDELKQLV